MTIGYDLVSREAICHPPAQSVWAAVIVCCTITSLAAVAK